MAMAPAVELKVLCGAPRSRNRGAFGVISSTKNQVFECLLLKVLSHFSLVANIHIICQNTPPAVK